MKILAFAGSLRKGSFNKSLLRAAKEVTPEGMNIEIEIATDGPGYKATQDESDLGEKIWLPDILENRREMIEKRLPEIKV